MSDAYYMTELKDLGDERGNLVVISAKKDVPFKIQRIFYDYNSCADLPRGNHANRNSKFAFISLSGKCTIEVDDGYHVEEFTLDNPRKMLVIQNMVWKVMKDFTKDNILLVISDHYYDKTEYITDYSEFRKAISNERSY